MSKIIYAKAFNNHLNDFFDDLIFIFTEINIDVSDLHIGKSSCQTIVKFNITSILKGWYKYTKPYNEQIVNGDVSFFLNKDYSDDLSTSTIKSSAEEVINRLRDPVKLLDDVNKEKSMQYIQNLTKLAKLYIENTEM
jgi:hypothetical protein